ncbi:transcription intermediary factor 1-alpha-like [Mizuhopecten yessoensis]|uniref:transcription intermediary factor 1-alpha-like n=1 Tax=Mizuhopecten yessoensis TaxID=6573 RepID=UPI000B45C581|nr:transcription intermediary factor 1-alpha-like [Mizuhopecten yessoensis]
MASNISVRRAQDLVTYTCALCDSEDGVRWYCNDCQENLCDWCKETHTRGKKTQNDDVVSIGKANRQSDKPIPEVCKIHPGKLCDLYCSDCNLLFCSMCLSKTHKHHNWKHFEDEFSIKKQHLKEHMTAISVKIEHFKNETSERHRVNEGFNDNIDTMRKEVNSQRTKLKAEVDYIADAILAELSALEKEESTMHKKDCQRKVEELTGLLEQAEIANISSVSLFETERSLRTTLPLYDVNVKYVSPKQSSFVTGSIDSVMLTKMLGILHSENRHEKTDIDSKHVQRLSKFTVTPKNQLNGIYPVDDSHAWLSLYQYQGLVLVNREDVVIETVKLDFCPCRIAMVGATDILMTSYPHSTFVYNLSLLDKDVTIFADIRTHDAYDISINKRDEVFVSTSTPDMVVLNQSGTIVRKVTIGSETIMFVVCLSPGCLCVVQTIGGRLYDRNIKITDESGTVIQTWTGEVNNGQQVGSMNLWKMSCDKYDRVFVPDISNNQVYVLPRDGKQAVCLLDQKHGVMEPTAVGVDTWGNVWIGCNDGTVHVMRL